MCYFAKAVLGILVSSLALIKAADVNEVFQTWLRPAKSGAGKGSSPHQSVDTELRQGLEGFLYLQNRRALERFLNSSTDTDQTGLLAGIITSASKLVDVDGDTVGDKLLALRELIDRVPEELEVWPLVRRVIVASLALRYGKHGPFASGTAAPIAQDILLQLYDQFKQSAKRKAVMEYAHVSKSGGTSFCHLARANGCHSEDFGWGNCLIKAFKDGPRYIDEAVHKQLQGQQQTRCRRNFKPMYPRDKEVSCADRRALLLDRGWSMYANEYTALGGREDPALAHPCRNMLTVLEIRHPHGRVISHLKHIWFLYHYHCGLDGRALYFRGGTNTSAWAALMPTPTNNYLIRSLLGEKVFNAPSGAITREHLDLARDFLSEQYDVVVVLEDKPLFKHVLRHGLGWGVDQMHANSRGEARDTREGLPLDIEALWELNRLDVELYQFGSLLARLDAIMYAAAKLTGGGSSSSSSSDGGGGGGEGGGAARRGSWSRSLMRRRGARGGGGGGGEEEGEGEASSGGGSGRPQSRRPFMTQQRNAAMAGTGTAVAAVAAVAGRKEGGLPACGWVGGSR